MKKLLLSFITIILIQVASYAQTERLYTVNGELPNSLITALAQDSVGNVWIGTENGLCKYDGAKFTTYFHSASDSASLLSDFVSDLFVTDAGHVMVGTLSGLQVYDRGYNQFGDIDLGLPYDGNSRRVPVSDIKGLGDGAVLVGTMGHGLFRIDSEDWAVSSVADKNRTGMFVNCLDVCPDNTVWVGAAREGALRGTWLPDGSLELSVVPGTQDWRIEDVVSDSRGNAYYATQHGVYRVSPTHLTPKLVFGYGRERIRCMMFDGERSLLLGTDGDGLLCYDIVDDRLVDTRFNTGRTDLSQAKVREMLVDRNGNLWAGLDQRGVLLCPARSNQFGYIGQGSAKADIIGAHPVMGLYQSPDGVLWVISDRDGLYAVTDSGSRHYPQGANGLPPLITNVFMASDGTLWVGAINNGMGRLNPATGVFTPVDSMRGLSVFDIVEDRDHRLWVATMGEGLFCTDLDGTVVYRAPRTDYRHYTPGSDLLNNAWINSLTLSNDGKRLFINTCYGVGCYDMEFGSFVNTFGENRILEGEMCYDSYQDADGNLWVATTDGVYRWHADDDDIAHYDTADGLCNNTVVGITGDDHGNIWMSTYYGLSKFDKSTGTFSNYYVYDGIQGNEFSLRSMYRNDQGRIYAGGLNGVTVFDGVDEQVRSPLLRVVDLYLHNQPLTLASVSDGKPIIKDGGDGRRYEFGASDNSIVVELSTDQFNNSNIRYHYKVDSGEWTVLEPGANKVYLSNLSPGEHRIEFKALSLGAESDVVGIDVHIRHHWYLRWWAVLLYVVLFAIISSVVVRAVIKRRRMEAQIAEHKLKDEHNHSAMQSLVDIAHEIRTPISLITNPINQLSELHTDPDSKHLFAIVRNNINRMLQLANQLMSVHRADHSRPDQQDSADGMPVFEDPGYALDTKTLKSKPTLYIIEDNAETRNYLHEQLQANYNIATYDNAKDALTAILSKKPDILITDIVLNGMDGLALIKNIRQNININDLPIIVLSARDNEADIMEAIVSGADHYMIKPFNMRLLKSYVYNLLSQRHRLKVIYKGDQSEPELVSDAPQIKTPDDQLMERLAKAINENISNPDYTIVDLASDVCMSRVHLNRKLKQLTNQSPSTYLRNMRLSKAAEMLRDRPGIAVSDVATAVGMTSFSHFSHAFKELYGCTPSEYANQDVKK